MNQSLNSNIRNNQFAPTKAIIVEGTPSIVLEKGYDFGFYSYKHTDVIPNIVISVPPEEVINTFILLSKALSSESCFYLEDFRETGSIKSVQLGVTSNFLENVLLENKNFVLNNGMFEISVVDRTKNVEIHLTREKAITIYTEVNEENQEVCAALLQVLNDLDINHQDNHPTIYNSGFNYEHSKFGDLDNLLNFLLR